MQAHPVRKRRPSSLQFALRPLLAAVATMSGAGAWADDPSPYYIGVSQGVTHDSNVLRTPGGPSDTYFTTSLLGGIDQPIGRQRLYATANVSYNKYREFDSQNNTSYGLTAGWDWATIAKLSGNVSVNANQSLASLNGNAAVTGTPTTGRNLLKADQVAATVRWGGDGLLSVESSYAHSRIRYSAPEALRSQSSANSVSLGLYYRPGPDLRLGTALRYVRTESPYAIPLASGAGYQSNTSNVRYLDLLADWRSTAQTNVNGRLSYTRQSNSSAGGRDFSGLTGSIAGRYAPTAKLAFSGSLSRDVGSNAQYYNYTRTSAATPLTGPITQTISGLAENSQTTDGLALGATYEVTSKVGMTAGYTYRRSKLIDTLGVGGTTATQDRNDTFSLASIGVNYAFARYLSFACSVAHESRRVGDTALVAGVSYGANVVGCSAQLTLR